jgi:hypothetical protein
MNKKLNSVPSAGTEAQQRTTDDVCSSPPAIANTHVVGSQSRLTPTETSKQLKIDISEGRVWVQIGNVGVGYDKANFVRMIEQSESYQFAANLKSGE